MHGLNGTTFANPKMCGGLRIKDLRLFNITLFGKWKWRVGTKSKRLWKMVLDSKYGSCRSLNNSTSNKFESCW